MQNENRLKESSESTKCNNIHIIGVPEEEREKVAENLLEEMMAENLPNLGEGNRYSDPEGTENSHQNQQKQIHIKMYYN